MSSERLLQFYVDEAQKKEKDKKRRRQRQRMGFLPKRRKLKTPKKLSLILPEDWPQYLRLMLIAGYRMIQDKQVRSLIQKCVPVDPRGSRLVFLEKLLDEKVKGLWDERLNPLLELAGRFEGKERMEPGLIGSVSQMLEELRDHFPRRGEDLNGTPYGLDVDLLKYNTWSDSMEKVLDSFKEAAKHGHVGAELVQAPEDGEEGDETEEADE